MTSGTAGLNWIASTETGCERRARIAGIKKAIRSGRYFVSAQDVARCLSRRLFLLRLPRDQARAQTW